MQPTPRFDMYRPIHKALRLRMCETLIALGRADVQDAGALASALDGVDQLLGNCRAHLQHEDAFLHPALERARAGASATTAADHAAHLTSIDRLEHGLTMARRAADGSRQGAVDALYDELAEFIGENLVHMRVEERDNNAALWAHHDDSQLLALHDALVASIPEDELADSLVLMARAAAPKARAQMLGGLKATLPATAFQPLFRAVLEALEPPARLQLQAALQDPVAA